jgi:hypothetical protein
MNATISVGCETVAKPDSKTSFATRAAVWISDSRIFNCNSLVLRFKSYKPSGLLLLWSSSKLLGMLTMIDPVLTAMRARTCSMRWNQ